VPEDLLQISSAEVSGVARPAADDAAAREVYQKYRRGLIIMLQRLVGDFATAEDLCQDACRIVAERLQTTPLEDPSRLVAFLHQTARNLGIAERRKRARRRTDVDSELLEQVEDRRFDPSDVAEREQLASAVRQLLEKMQQPRDRLLLMRVFFDDADRGAICAELGLTEAHFRRVLFRAKRRFREILERSGIGALLALIGGCAYLVASVSVSPD
jgi:RNA polymerase sigma-70 factor, ECF subfamily